MNRLVHEALLVGFIAGFVLAAAFAGLQRRWRLARSARAWQRANAALHQDARDGARDGGWFT